MAVCFRDAAKESGGEKDGTFHNFAISLRHNTRVRGAELRRLSTRVGTLYVFATCIMLRALLLALVASSAAFFAPGVAMRPAVSRPALAARPMAPLKPALRMMAEETETTSEVVPLVYGQTARSRAVFLRNAEFHVGSYPWVSGAPLSAVLSTPTI